jgi:hypothetical protein
MSPRQPPHPHFKERSFGISVGVVLLLVAAFMLWRGRLVGAEVLAGAGAVLLLCGLTYPPLLKYPSRAWWAMAAVLGYVNARVILTVAFLILLTPIGLIWRVIGRDPLKRKRTNFDGWSPYPARYRDRNHFNRMY